MSPTKTTIILNARAQHSVTFDHTNESITVSLAGDNVPLEKIPNKRRLMLLVYFAQRDQDRTSSPTHRRIDQEIALDVRIVERLIWGFSNIQQAKRTLREYTEVGDHVETAAGMLRPRTEPDAFGKGTRAIKMTVTAQIRDCILEWMNDILAPENLHRRPAGMGNPSEDVSTAGRNELIDLSSPAPEIISDDDLQIIAPPSKRKRTARRHFAAQEDDMGVLTPGSTRSFPQGVQEQRLSPTVRGEDFQKLFPSSPPRGESTTAAPAPSRSIIEIEDTPIPDTTGNPSSEGTSLHLACEISPNVRAESSEFVDAPYIEMDDAGEDEGAEEGEEEANGGESEKNSQPPWSIPASFMTKLQLYAKHLYNDARNDKADGVRKYSRKLKRLIQEAQPSAQEG